MAKKLKPVHPGEILREEFMAPLRLSMNRMALDLRVPGDAHREYRCGAPQHHCRHGPALRALFQEQPCLLDESANSLRPGSRRG